MVEDVGELGKGAAGAEADAHHLLLHHPTRGVGAGADRRRPSPRRRLEEGRNLVVTIGGTVWRLVLELQQIRMDLNIKRRSKMTILQPINERWICAAIYDKCESSASADRRPHTLRFLSRGGCLCTYVKPLGW